MNHIYRLVWNKKRHMLMAVAEVASTNRKETGDDSSAGSTLAAAGGGMPGARTLVAAAVIALFPMAASAQLGDTQYIPFNDGLTLSDSNGSNAAAAGWRMNNDGTLDIRGTDAGSTVLGLSGSGTVLLGEHTLTLSDAADLFSGKIIGSGGLFLAGGMEILGGVNGYAGATAIAADSTLALAGSGSIALSSGVLNNGKFDISAADNDVRIRSLAGSDAGRVALGGRTLVLSAASGEFAGSIEGEGGLTVTSGSEVLSGANRYTGATTVSKNASLLLAGDGSIADSRNVRVDGTLSLWMTNEDTALQSLSGSGAVQLGDGTLELSGNGSAFSGRIDGQGGLTVSHGTHTLNGATGYTGATSIGPDGTLALGGSGTIAMSSGLFNGGRFDIAATNNGAQIKTMAGNGTVWLGGKTLTLTNAAG